MWKTDLLFLFRLLEHVVWGEVVEQELLGPMQCCLEAGRRLSAIAEATQSRAGRIISFCSMSGKTGVHKHVAPYAAAKGAVRLMSKAAAVHCAQNGDKIRVNSVHPGGIVTPMTQAVGKQVAEAIARDPRNKPSVRGTTRKSPLA